MSRTVASARTVGSPRTAGSARTPLPTPAHMQPGTLFEDFESGWSVLSGGSVSHVSEHVKTGTKSLKCVTNVGANLFANKAISQTLATASNFSLWVYVESPYGDVTQPSQISCYIAFSKDGFASSSIIASTTNISLSHGWNRIVWGRPEFTINGSTTWADTFDTFRLKVLAIPGQSLTMHFDSLTVNDIARPLIVIDFDDGWDSTKSEAFDYMSPLGLVGNVMLVSSFLDQANRLTTSNVQTLFDGGWDVSNHTATHQDMTTFSEAEAGAEWQACDSLLRNSGWVRCECHRHTGTPNGGYGAGVLSSLSSGAFLTGRNSDGSLLPPVIDNQYHCRIHFVAGLSENSAATLIAHVDRAISAGAGIRFVIHRIIAGSPTTDSELGRTAFRGLMDYLAKINRVKADIVTWSHAYALSSGLRRTAM